MDGMAFASRELTSMMNMTREERISGTISHCMIGFSSKWLDKASH
jgi:hypothetical protein